MPAGCARVAQYDGVIVMAFIATFLFIVLFAYGRTYFGWDDPKGDVQIALFSAFVFGIICGFRVRN